MPNCWLSDLRGTPFAWIHDSQGYIKRITMILDTVGFEAVGGVNGI